MNTWETWLSNWLKQIPFRSAGYPLVISSDFSRMAAKAASLRSQSDPLALTRIIEDQFPGITILIPAFKNRYGSDELFDPSNTLPETGSLAGKALKEHAFVRTTDPLHSFLVKGPLTSSCKQSLDESTFGVHSVFGWLHQQKAFQLLIDVDLQHSFTFAHYVEEQMKVKYRCYKNLFILVKQPDNKILEKKVKYYAKKPGYMVCLNRLQPVLAEGEALLRGECNGISWTLIDLSKAYNIISDEIKFHQARNLIIFDRKQFFRDILKLLLNKE